MGKETIRDALAGVGAWERLRLATIIARRYETQARRSRNLGIAPPDKNAFAQVLINRYRTDFRCEYCHHVLELDSTDNEYRWVPSYDHRIPLEAGGTNEIDNFAVICHRCNIVKRTASETSYRALIAGLGDAFEAWAEESWAGARAEKISRSNAESRATP